MSIANIIAQIPPAELELLPAGMPPNGTVSNFIDPENRGNLFIVVAAIFLGLTALAVILRLYVRCIVQKSPWWDDLAVIIAVIFQATSAGYNIWLCKHGVGKHMWDVRIINALSLINPAKIMGNLAAPLIGFTKLALLLLYYRLFSPDHIIKMAIIFGIVFTTVSCVTLEILFIFTAREVQLNKAVAVFNVFGDVYIFVLPMYSVLKLHLPKRKKIGVAFVFASGALAVAMSVVGAVFRFEFSDGTDTTWDLLNCILVNHIENCVGIICSCMPLFPALIRNAHFISINWIVSIRSLRNFKFNSGDPSHGSSQHSKWEDTDTFVHLNEPSGSSSLKALGNSHYSIAEIHTETPRLLHTHNYGIEVTTDYSVARTDNWVNNKALCQAI